MELFDKACKYGCFLHQRHVEWARGFHVLKGVECPPTHSLFDPRSMASLNVQIIRKDLFHKFTPFLQRPSAIWNNCKLICNGLPYQAFSIEMWSNALGHPARAFESMLNTFDWFRTLRPSIQGFKPLHDSCCILEIAETAIQAAHTVARLLATFRGTVLMKNEE